MPHVSKAKLKKEIFSKLFNKFISTFEVANKNGEFSFIIKELFTDTEKIMLTKRLIIILLLDKEIPQHRIVEMIHVSPSTVAKMSLKLEIGKYDSIIKITKKKNQGVIDLVEFLLAGVGLMPPVAGKGRWKKIFRKI